MLKVSIKSGLKKVFIKNLDDYEYISSSDEGDDDVEYEFHSLIVPIPFNDLNELLKKPITELEFNQIISELDNLEQDELLKVLGTSEKKIRKYFKIITDEDLDYLEFSVGIQSSDDTIFPTFYLSEE